MKTRFFGCFVLFLAACEQPYSNDDLVFIKSLPNTDLVKIDVPAEEGPLPAPGEGATYYRLAQTVTDQANTAVYNVLSIVDRVAKTEPQGRAPDRLRWGPIVEENVTYTLEIVRTSTPGVRVPTSSITILPVEARFDFTIEAWNNINQDLRGFVAGGSFVPLEQGQRGIGSLYVNLEAVSAIDPSQSDRGYYWAAYDTRTPKLDLFLGFYLPEDLGGNLVDPDSYFEKHVASDGATALYFYTTTMNPDGFLLNARWRPDNRGRADVAYIDHDLREPPLAAECWDGEFRRVYFRATLPQLGGPSGEVTDCAPEHQEPEYQP